MDSNEHTGREHDGSNSKAIGIGQICKVGEDRNDHNGCNHKNPVKSRDVNLALVRFRGLHHANGRERSAVDNLLDKTESTRDQSLRCDELDGPSVKPEMLE